MSAAISYKSSLCRNPPCSTCHSFVGENEVWPRVSYAIEPSNLLFACNFIPVDNILLILLWVLAQDKRQGAVVVQSKCFQLHGQTQILYSFTYVTSSSSSSSSFLYSFVFLFFFFF